ncbi:MAG: phosphoribulokinase [Oceanicoccus sp.]
MHWQEVETSLNTFINDHQLPNNFYGLAKQWYWPLARRLLDHQSSIRLLGINGAQGTGKSTLASLLKLFLEVGAGLNVVALSLDDFYLTRDERATLAETVHPMLQVRGVPGTHDIQFATATIKQLIHDKPGTVVSLPRFDKSIDDREPELAWPTTTTPVDLVIFEGWCVGSTPEDKTALQQPINALETELDVDRMWRHYVNEQLTSDYQTLFALMDGIVMLKAPSMEVILEWRWLQEQKLSDLKGISRSGVMNQSQVQRFIQYYERLTRHNLSEMPSRANLVYHIGNDHGIDKTSGSWS